MSGHSRFEVELEFVQTLANPNYLSFLAVEGFLKDSRFINYLAYLQYWKQPEYASFIKYPHCLYFLDLLQTPAFREELDSTAYTDFIGRQQILQWIHYNHNRSQQILPQFDENTAQQQQQQHEEQP